MIGGFMTTSRIALAAAAGLLIGATFTPAKAADLGGGCCADLEERVAELEATTARKGNRVVSLQVYGQINKALLIWDDGVDSDAFVVDHDVAGSRFGFKGKARIKPGWTAGYNMEFGVDDNGSNDVTQADDDNTEDAFNIRQNYFYIESDRLGRLSLGHQSTAADGATQVVLGNSLSHSGAGAGNSFVIRGTRHHDHEPSGEHDHSTLSTLGDWSSNLDGGRFDVVRYDSPAIMGFILSASWGENDYADLVLRFKKEFNSIRLVAGIGYIWADEAGFEELAGSASAMHVPTGLYVAFAAADRDNEDTSTDQKMWYVQGGIEKKFLPYGSTTVYGEYGQYTTENAFDSYIVHDDHVVGFAIGDADATRVGFGIVQKIDSAAMDIYAQASMWSFDDDNAETEYEDLTTIMVGSRIKF